MAGFLRCARCRVSIWIASLASALLLFASPAAFADADADALKATQSVLADQLAHNPFQRPLVLASTQSSGDLKGDVHAIVNHPFSSIDAALKRADNWCDVLILHLNVKQCRAGTTTAGSTLAVSIGKKHDQPLADAYRVDFNYRVVAEAPDYLQVTLKAASGPLGTRDYRITFEAIPLDATRSFIHMSYSYGYGFAARIAMQGYLSTIGSGKVGFSVVSHTADGKPVYVDNVRGVVERNTMRYYLAIDAYLNSLSAPPGDRVERRLHDWFAATERYPLQLHEVEQNDYLDMKRKELQRQQPG